MGRRISTKKPSIGNKVKYLYVFFLFVVFVLIVYYIFNYNIMKNSVDGALNKIINETNQAIGVDKNEQPRYQEQDKRYLDDMIKKHKANKD